MSCLQTIRSEWRRSLFWIFTLFWLNFSICSFLLNFLFCYPSKYHICTKTRMCPDQLIQCSERVGIMMCFRLCKYNLIVSEYHLENHIKFKNEEQPLCVFHVTFLLDALSARRSTSSSIEAAALGPNIYQLLPCHNQEKNCRVWYCVFPKKNIHIFQR